MYRNILIGNVLNIMIPWTVAHQPSLSMGFSRQEYWSGLTFPSPVDLPNSEIKLWSPKLHRCFTIWATGEASIEYIWNCWSFSTLKYNLGTFLVVQRLRLCLPMQGVWVWSLVGELSSPIPHSQKTKTWNRSNIVTNSIKTLKVVHIKKKKKTYKIT